MIYINHIKNNFNIYGLTHGELLLWYINDIKTHRFTQYINWCDS